jgi:ABC-type sugar transport system ATPase subunit
MTEDEEDELFKYLHMLKSSGKAIIVYASRPPRPLLVDRVITMEGGSLREDKTFLNDKIMRHD